MTTTETAPAVNTPQITVLDTGGQYTHLIARRIRELGVYADVQASDVPLQKLANRRGVIISGGPASVYEPDSPGIDPALLSASIPVLGICYGHQLMAQILGGAVQQGEHGEYGVAHLRDLAEHDPLWRDISQTQIWMSHRDKVQSPPPGFRITAATDTSDIAAMSDPARKLFGLQFHPEVVHTHAGTQILTNFVFNICGATRDWDVSQRVPLVEEQIRSVAGNRSIFFFVSGGVDSTVAYTLCLQALGPERVYGLYVDTGLMRSGETEAVERMFTEIGARHFRVEHAQQEFLDALKGLHDPEEKRRAIGEQFVRVQERLLASEHFLNGHWILGQGTIYPDTIESGGTAKADLIKTHHNRVAGIQALIDSGRIIEPLTSFYKDEVREIGKEVGIPEEFLIRHPFPGPGLAIRCLGSRISAELERTEDGYLLPLRSVGVQGDSRSYRAAMAIAQPPSANLVQVVAPALINRRRDINRVVALCATRERLEHLTVREAAITGERLEILRSADHIVRSFCLETGFEAKVWQFPVVLLPLGTPSAPESIVLRPINSVDGMTADVTLMSASDLDVLSSRIMLIPSVAAVFYDLTHKPPGTIEWE